MLKNDMLSLPYNWEAILEMSMLQTPPGGKQAYTYICSPCRDDRPEGVIRNMKAARVYMFYAYLHFKGIPKAPHAYMPILLNDNCNDERQIALQLGERLLMNCDLMLVCGDRLSEGMYREIATAFQRGILARVFNKQVYDDLRTRLPLDGITPDYPLYDSDSLHFALSWGADKLAPFWEEDRSA